MAYRRIRSEAILLRAVDFGESDRIVHLLCPRIGRLTAMAKGARRSVKRFAGTLDLCNLLRIDVEQRRSQSMARLDQAVLIHPFLGLRERPARFALACYLIEIVDRMAPEGGAPADLERIYAFTRAALRLIETGEPDGRLRVLLELRVLAALGLRPELRVCVGCGTEPRAGDAVGFRIPDGGLLCGACGVRREGTFRVHLGTLRSLDRALSLPLEGLGRLALAGEALEEARRLVSRFQRFHLGIELRSERVLDGLMATGVPAGPAA
jgi:DNA repair protein RecO (recombination protein O)